MKARVSVHRDFTIAPIDGRIYSAFLEHLGRAVYGGIHEPRHPTADANGFRGDVLALVRELAPPLVRYPGGNFVSNYDWQDGIGPRERRPARLDLAWRTTEPNTIGTDDFADWCAKAGTQMMLAVNLGTRGIAEALALLEYCNHPGGSAWSDLRRKHGHPQPHNVRTWCLGNEMDGPWQVGHKTAHEYGRLANETARAMKAFDPQLELVLGGSSGHAMPTYPAWEAEVLDEAYDAVDYVSLHEYWDNYEDDYLNFLAKPLATERYIRTVGGVIDYVKAKKRSRHTVAISFDEWNVWYHNRRADDAAVKRADWPVAPPLLEEAYTFEDVLVVACALNTFIRNSDRVKIACIAQLVNVIAPIMTVPGGPAWRQATFYPLMLASRHGRGEALAVAVEVPTYDARVADDVPYLDVAAVAAADGRSVTFFMVNRHPDERLAVDIGMAGFAPTAIAEHTVMAHADLAATNTARAPGRLVPAKGRGLAVRNGVVKGSLPPRSYHVVRVAVASPARSR